MNKTTGKGIILYLAWMKSTWFKNVRMEFPKWMICVAQCITNSRISILPLGIRTRWNKNAPCFMLGDAILTQAIIHSSWIIACLLPCPRRQPPLSTPRPKLLILNFRQFQINHWIEVFVEWIDFIRSTIAILWWSLEYGERAAKNSWFYYSY